MARQGSVRHGQARQGQARPGKARLGGDAHFTNQGRIEVYTAKFELKALSALLMHADDVQESDRLMAWRRDPKNKNISVAGDDRSPAWTWQTYMYSDGTNIAIPSANFLTALRIAGARKILKRQTTYKEITQSGIICVSEYLKFTNDGKSIPFKSILSIAGDNNYTEHLAAVRKLGFDLYAKRARIGSSKHIRVRAKFTNWAIAGELQVYAEDVITKAVLLELLGLAGRVGLGDWRPGCKTPGPYGMFEAKLA